MRKKKSYKPRVQFKPIEIIKLDRQGQSTKFIAEKIGISLATVYRILRQEHEIREKRNEKRRKAKNAKEKEREITEQFIHTPA
jgi:transposase